MCYLKLALYHSTFLIQNGPPKRTTFSLLSLFKWDHQPNVLFGHQTILCFIWASNHSIVPSKITMDYQKVHQLSTVIILLYWHKIFPQQFLIQDEKPRRPTALYSHNVKRTSNQMCYQKLIESLHITKLIVFSDNSCVNCDFLSLPPFLSLIKSQMYLLLCFVSPFISF